MMAGPQMQTSLEKPLSWKVEIDMSQKQKKTYYFPWVILGWVYDGIPISWFMKESPYNWVV